MSKPRSVLICLDSNQQNSLSILKEFVEKFHKPDDIIVILTVFDYSSIEAPVNFNVDDISFNADLWRKSLKEARELILVNHNQCREFLRKRGIPDQNVDTLLSDASDGVGTVICTESTALDCDVIFMGKHMKGVIGRVFIGSNSTYVAHHTTKPTLFITVPG